MIRKIYLGLGALIIAGLATSPALAQRNTHGAGVSWSGSHGGVNWDGATPMRAETLAATGRLLPISCVQTFASRLQGAEALNFGRSRRRGA